MRWQGRADGTACTGANARRRPGPTANRRRWLVTASSALLGMGWPALRAQTGRPPAQVLTLYTFGDSILDCARYNAHGVHPGQLIVRNDDVLFPEFKGNDLLARGPARLAHHAVDGAVVDDLAGQMRGLRASGGAVALVTVGGNDLLRGLARDTGAGLRRFEATLDRFLKALPIRPVLLGTVYDPTFGDDSRNFLDVPPERVRANHRRVNTVIETLAARVGKVADLHAHFLRGDPSWFTRTIEPSLIGASEIRRVFLPLL